MKFVAMAAYDTETAAAQDPAASQRLVEEINAWFDKYDAQGKIAWSGHQLDGAESAKTVRAGADGEPVVVDGPFVEAKEVIGGIATLEFDSMEEAVEVCKDWAHFGYGLSLELRPVLEME